MKAGVRLQVGDKVVLHPYYLPGETGMRPRPKHGAVYCVRLVEENATGGQYVRLVGRQCLSRDRQREVSFTAETFCRVGAVARKEDA